MKKVKHKQYFSVKLFIAALVLISFVAVSKNHVQINKQQEELKALYEEEERIRIDTEEIQNLLDTPIDDEYIAQVVKDRLNYRKSYGILYYNDLHD